MDPRAAGRGRRRGRKEERHKANVTRSRINGQFIGQILMLCKFYERLAVLPCGYVNLPLFVPLLMEPFANTFLPAGFEQLSIPFEGRNEPRKRAAEV